MAAGNTYVAIAEQTLGSAAASVTFSSISGSYTDLVLIFSGSAASGNPLVTLQFNGDTGTNYSDTTLSGNGTAASSGRDTSVAQIYASGADSLSTGISQLIVNLQNYSNTTTYKTVITRSGNAANGTSAVIGLWRSTSAINSIKIFNHTATNFASGSTFSLYGIQSA